MGGQRWSKIIIVASVEMNESSEDISSGFFVFGYFVCAVSFRVDTKKIKFFYVYNFAFTYNNLHH